MPGGELRAVLEQFALALLRHDADARKVLGPYNRVSGLLERAARKANIFDSRFPSDPSLPRMCPTLVMGKWGEIIEKDYRARLAISCRRAEGEQDTEVAPLTLGISNIEEMMKKMVDNQNKIMDENVALRAQVQMLSSTVVFLKNGLHYANERLHSIDNGNRRLSSFLKSPDKVASSSAVEPPPPPTFAVNSIPTFAAADLDAEADEEVLKPSAQSGAMMKQTSSLSNAATLPLLSSAEDPTNQTHQKPIVQISGWNNHAQSKSTIKESDAKSKVSSFLLTLRENGYINSQQKIASVDLPDWICASGNKCYYRYCLEFIQFIAGTNQALALCIANLTDKSIDDTAALTAAQEIAKACFDNIKALDGKQVRKRTTIALGIRVRDYKQKIASAKQKIHPDQKFTVENVDELRQLIAEGNPGAPEGNHSILLYAATKK